LFGSFIFNQMSAEAELASLQRLDDRISSTSNDKLSDVLRLALPALIKLINKDELRTRVFALFSALMKRLKNLNECKLPLEALVMLLRQENLPFAANFSITFIDIAWDRQSDKDVSLTVALLESILDWPLYGVQSNTLLAYSWQVIEHFPAAIEILKERSDAKGGEDRSEEIKSILSDYYLDMCLVHSTTIKKGQAGSVLPGLSDGRVGRLMAKREELRPKEDLQAHKLVVVSLLLDDKVFLPWAAVAIATVLAYDSDVLVAQAAAFKMNAQSSRKDLKALEGDAANQLLSHLLHLCSPTSVALASKAPATATAMSPYSNARSALRDDIRAQLVRWAAKEMRTRLVGVSRSVLKVFVDSTFTTVSTVRFRAAAVLLGTALADSMDDAAFTAVVPIYLQGIESVLQSFITRSSEYDSTDGKQTRELSYACLEKMSHRVPLLVIRSASVVSTLFKLLDSEDEILVPKLYGALGALREAYQSRMQHLTDAEAAKADEDATPADASTLIAITQANNAVRSSQTLQDVIVLARSSDAPKKRLAALQWARAVFEWERIALETLVILADDSKPAVAAAVAKEFTALRGQMNETRANLLINVATSPLCRAATELRSAARMELFRALSGYFSLNINKQLGYAEEDTMPLVSTKRWTDIVNASAAQKGDDVEDNCAELIDVLVEEEGTTTSATHVMHRRMIDASADLLRNILLSSNHPGRRTRARKLNKVLLSWLHDCENAVTSQRIADIFGTLCLDSLDTFIATAQETLMTAIDTARAAENPNKIFHRRNLELQQMNAMRCLSTMLEACETRLHIKVYSALVEQSKQLQMALFGIFHEVFKNSSGASIALRIVALQSYSRILRHEVFVNKLMAHVLTFNAIEPPYLASPEGVVNPTIPIHEQILQLLQDFFREKEAEPSSSSSASGSGSPRGSTNAYSSSFLSDSSAASAAQSTVATAQKVMDSEHAAFASECISALCNYCTWSVDTPAKETSKATFAGRVWTMLTTRRVWQAENPLVRFALAEGLLRVSVERTSLEEAPRALVPLAASSNGGDVIAPYTGKRAILGAPELENRGLPVTIVGEDAVSRAYPPTLSRVLSMVDGIVIESSGGTSAVREKGTAAVILLVFVRHYAALCHMWTASKEAEVATTMPFSLVIRLVDVLLRLLNDSQPFTQDIACLGLCHLHAMAQRVSILDSGNGKTAVQIVSEEVINTLAREKRAAAPPGVDVNNRADNSSTGTSSTGNGNANGDNNDSGSTNNPNTARERDALAAAAATAARELGINIDQQERENIARVGADAADAVAHRPLPAWRLRDVNPGNYGVYSTAIKVARKSGDASVVFGVLSLIRRDPAFGAVEGDTELLYVGYKPPLARVERARIKELIPMLFLAKHDPYPTVKEVMKRLWDMLVTPEYQRFVLSIPLQNKIVDFLGSNLITPVWRDREAACSALEIFLVQRSWPQLRPRINLLWAGGMAVLDDVRDSTRLAALGYVKVLSDQILRACDPAESPQERVIECAGIMLPVLMDRGLVAPTPEGRGVALGLLVRIIKAARNMLEPWLPRLVSVLVEAMSALEPQTLQYMSFHTARLHISEEELEQKRLQLSQHSPMQEALDGCLNSLSRDNLPETVLVLCDQLSRGVGLTTRAAAAQALSFLAEKYPGDLGPYSTRAFSEAISLLLTAPSMAPSLRHSLLSCLGALGKVINPNDLEAAVRRLITSYNSLGRETRDQSAAVIAACIQQLINRCSSQLIDHDVWTALLACVYVGTFDADAKSRDTWAAVWGETLSQSGAGNKGTALRRTLMSVLSTVSQYLHDLSWTRRSHGLAILDDICRSLPGEQVAPNVGYVIKDLLWLLPGKIWSGQGQVLALLSLLVTKCENCLDCTVARDVVLLSVPRTVDGNTDRKEVGAAQTVLSLADLLVWKLRAEEGGDAELPTMEISFDVTHRWSISTRGMLALLVNEAGRGEKTYRLEAAAALAALPWTKLVATPAGAAVFEEALPLLAATVGMPPFVPPAMVAMLASQASKDIDGSRSTAPSIKTVQQHIRDKTRPSTYKKKESSLSLFGGRYVGESTVVGAGSSHDNKRKFTDTTINSASNGDFDVITLHNPTKSYVNGAIYHGIGGAPETSLDSNSHAIVANVPPSAVLAPLPISGVVPPPAPASTVQPEDAAASDDMVLAEEVQLELPAELPVYEPVSSIPESEPKSTAAEEGPGPAEFFSSSGLRIPVSADPAFRVKFLECLVNGWPKLAGSEQIVSARKPIFAWARTAVASDVWSLRKTTLELLRAVLADETYTASAADLELVLAAISAGAGDRNMKVRLPALKCLDSFLNVQCKKQGVKSILSSASMESIRGILRAASTDSEPAMIQAGMKLQADWLQLSN